MTLDLPALRVAIVGLVAFAAGEEALLLTAAYATPGPGGSAERWAPVPIVAHNTDFKRQQVARLRALRDGRTPEEYADVDHRSATLYAAYAALPREQVLSDHRLVVNDLVDEVTAASDDDLANPDRNPWLRGRQLWLQIIVRGFWHPTGHLGDYYLESGAAERALALHQHAVATANYLRAPDPARGMAYYSLGCTEARLGLADAARASIDIAVEHNRDLHAKAASDPDLISLR
jgi:tetratricopeptide (TPR) repeat protein